MRKCLNDMFGGYCSETPQVGETKDISDTFDYPDKEQHSEVREKCSLSPRSCGSYLKFSEVVKTVVGLGSGVRIRTAEKAEVVKHSSKKKKRGEVSHEQGALL